MIIVKISSPTLPYAGFGAFIRILREARFYNTLSNPLFNNLRAGNWLLDFLISRYSTLLNKIQG
jgi:hypothetical protein